MAHDIIAGPGGLYGLYTMISRHALPPNSVKALTLHTFMLVCCSKYLAFGYHAVACIPLNITRYMPIPVWL